ncbi:NnrU family protein [Ponticaulis sp.]|uniref:NnrU family protein n=1 Tax=Ponticaulis sp. TaxID=2020902 RepID=UPI0025EBDAEF|nr:NnrU family protein [Ponticaulis sp.]
MSVFAPVMHAVRFIKENKAKMFWLWIAYQAVKGSITLTMIWIPLFLLWKNGAGADVEFRDWAPFIAAMILFPLSHAIIMRPKVKQALIGRLGAVPYRVMFSIVSLGLFSWLVFETLGAPVIPLWVSTPWQHWLAVIFSVLGFLLLVFGTAIANPFSAFSNGKAYRPEQASVLRVTRHPALFGIVLWAQGHIIANGEFAKLVFFLAQLVFALIGAAALERRAKKLMDAEDWERLTASTSFFPNPAGLFSGIQDSRKFIIRFGISVIVIIGLILLHPSLIGVSPMALISGR